MLRRFADAYHVGYPMLSDKGSVVIRKFGILNTNVPPDVTRFYGIPFPGQYLIAPDGVVKDKIFLDDYQGRPTASQILLKDYGVGGNSVTLKAEDITAKVTLSDSQSVSGHELGVEVAFELGPGWHIYGEPLPPEYKGTKVTFADNLVARQSLKFPEPVPVRFEALGQTLPVYKGSLKAIGSVQLKQRLEPGDHNLRGIIEFQECSETTCKIPQSAHFELPLKIVPMTPPAPTT